MRPYLLKIAAGAEEPVTFGGPVNYIRLYPTASVNVKIRTEDTGLEYTLRPGEDADLKAFDNLLVSHDGAGEEVFTLYVGKDERVGGAEISGNVTLIGGPVDEIKNPVNVQSIADPLTPQALFSSYYVVLAASTLVTILSPAANINGVRIDYAYLLMSSSLGNSCRLTCKSSAPIIYDDQNAATILIGTLNSTSGHVANGERQVPFLVPAGMGIYVQASDVPIVRVSLSYEVL